MGLEKEGTDMIHVFFSELAAGVMRFQQRAGKICVEDEILCLGFMFDQGDIQQRYDSEYRSSYLMHLFKQNGWNDEENRIQKQIEQYSKDVQCLIQAATDHEPIRIYNDNSPGDVCGFAFACSLLDPFDIGISYVEIPMMIHEPDYILANPSFEEILYNYFDQTMSLAVDVPYYDVNYYSNIWQMLKEENGPLRAVLNGQLVSVPENIYDFMILNCLDAPKTELQMMSEMVENHQKKLSDYWIAERVEQLIEEGKITVLIDKEYPYQRVLIRTN